MSGKRVAKKTREERQVERRERWLRLAPRRVERAIRALERLANCASRQSYHYTEQERAELIAAIKTAVKELEDSFAGTSRERPVFAFSHASNGI